MYIYIYIHVYIHMYLCIHVYMYRATLARHARFGWHARHHRWNSNPRPQSQTSSKLVFLILHLSKLVIWGSSWGRGFRFHWLCQTVRSLAPARPRCARPLSSANLEGPKGVPRNGGRTQQLVRSCFAPDSLHVETLTLTSTDVQTTFLGTPLAPLKCEVPEAPP